MMRFRPFRLLPSAQCAATVPVANSSLLTTRSVVPQCGAAVPVADSSLVTTPTGCHVCDTRRHLPIILFRQAAVPFLATHSTLLSFLRKPAFVRGGAAPEATRVSQIAHDAERRTTMWRDSPCRGSRLGDDAERRGTFSHRLSRSTTFTTTPRRTSPGRSGSRSREQWGPEPVRSK